MKVTKLQNKVNVVEQVAESVGRCFDKGAFFLFGHGLRIDAVAERGVSGLNFFA